MKSSRSIEIIVRPGERIDRFMDGRLKLIQSKDGYRFSIDAILLAEFVTIRQGDVVVDLGTGCGVIPLFLLLIKSVGYSFGLEIQEELAGQAARNVLLNGFDANQVEPTSDFEPLPAGRPLQKPKPIFKKLDDSVVEEELARMAN